MDASGTNNGAPDAGGRCRLRGVASVVLRLIPTAGDPGQGKP
jgi:hypothetical protein